VTILGTSIVRIADGKIAERWNITDMAGLMQQIAP
jgi:predicted ester cyclase